MPKPITPQKITNVTPITQVRETAPIPQKNIAPKVQLTEFTPEELEKAKKAK